MPQKSEPLRELWERKANKMSPEDLQALKDEISSHPEMSVVEILKAHNIGANLSAAVQEWFGINSAERIHTYRKLRSIRVLLDKIHDLPALERKLKAGVISSHDVRAAYGLNYNQWRLLLDYLGLDHKAMKTFKGKSLAPETLQSFVVRDSLTGDGSSLEWLSKRW